MSQLKQLMAIPGIGGLKFSALDIYNIQGELMMQRQNCMEFSIHHLENGVYILQTTKGETQKLILKK